MAGIAAQVAGLRLQLNAIQVEQQQLGLQLNVMGLQVNAMHQQQQQQRHCNSLLRIANSHARRGDEDLHVISKEQAGGQQPLGAQPAVQPDGSYPATASDLRALTHGQLDTLAAFYHEYFGISPAAAQLGQARTPILQRRRMFALFVGFLQP